MVESFLMGEAPSRKRGVNTLGWRSPVRSEDGFESWLRVTHLIPKAQQASKSLQASGVMAGVR